MLINRAQECGRFRDGIYWCHLVGSAPIQDSPLVAELVAAIGSNLQFVGIEGFDELMVAVERSVQASTRDPWSEGIVLEDAAGPIQVNDLQASALDISALSESLLRTKLVEYAAAMRLSPPMLGASEQLWEAMLAQDLGIAVCSGRKATKGGQLLFAKGEEQQIEAAKVLVTVSGPGDGVDEVLDSRPHASLRSS